MRYSILDALACPKTKEPLVLLGAVEEPRPLPSPYASPATRVSPPGAIVGCFSGAPASPLGEVLSRLAPPPQDGQRNEAVIVKEGLLVAPTTGDWYPIVDEVPEVLPDSLRNWDRDIAFLNRVSAQLPDDICRLIKRTADTAPRPGDNHKVSEMAAIDKMPDQNLFLGPGYVSPFNPGAFFHSSELIRGFGCCIPFMRLRLGSYVLDSGCGYSWTTEWFMKMGIHAIGVELERRYVDVGRVRMGANQPDLVIADAENLPFKPAFFDAVLGFDAFHHIPNRKIAMAEFNRVLKPGGGVTLVEPGGEVGDEAKRIMAELGTLEIGMELSDVMDYVAGIPEFEEPVETFLIPYSTNDTRWAINPAEMRNRDFIGWCLYTIRKKG